MTEEHDTVDATLSVAGADCEVTALRSRDIDQQEVTVTLTEDGLEDLFTELRLYEYDEEIHEWMFGGE